MGGSRYRTYLIGLVYGYNRLGNSIPGIHLSIWTALCTYYAVLIIINPLGWDSTTVLYMKMQNSPRRLYFFVQFLARKLRSKINRKQKLPFHKKSPY